MLCVHYLFSPKYIEREVIYIKQKQNYRTKCTFETLLPFLHSLEMNESAGSSILQILFIQDSSFLLGFLWVRVYMKNVRKMRRLSHEYSHFCVNKG